MTDLYKQLSSLPGGPLREPGEFGSERPRLVRAVLLHLRDQLSYTDSQLAALMRTTESRLRSFYLGEVERPRLRAITNRPQIPWNES